MRAIVSSPALRPATHGLLQVANIISPGDTRWEEGVNFTLRGCDMIFGHEHGCWTPRGNKSLQECKGLGVFKPYVLETSLVWATGDMAADPKAMVRETMEIGASSVLERLIEMAIVDVDDGDELEIVTGDGSFVTTGITGRVTAGGDDNPKLADGLSLGLTAATVVPAIAAMERKFLDAGDHTGGAGTIYMSPLYLPAAFDALREADGQLFTRATGSRVVVGNFGDNAIYGHIGEVDVYLGEIDVKDVVERSKNEYIIQAEQVIAVTWNTCAAWEQEIDDDAVFANYGMSAP